MKGINKISLSCDLDMGSYRKEVTEGGFPGSLAGKESACSVGDLGSIPGLGRFPGGGHGNPLQYSCLENPQGQRSLVGYSPWGHTELDKTEQLSTAAWNTGAWFTHQGPNPCPLQWK